MWKVAKTGVPFLLAGVLPLLAGCGGELLDEKNPFYLRGMRLQQEEKYVDAADAFEKCLRLSPNSAKADLQLAMLCEDKLGDPAGAVIHYRAYLRKAPNSDDGERTKKFLERAERMVLQQYMERYPGDVETMLAKNAEGSPVAAQTPRERFLFQRVKTLNEENARLKLDLDKLQQGGEAAQPPVASGEPVAEPVSEPLSAGGAPPVASGVPPAGPLPGAPTSAVAVSAPPPSGSGRGAIVPLSELRPGATPAAGAKPAVRSTYKVQKGDTLSSVARKVYGTTSLWPLIRDANADALHGGSSLREGMTLKIPAKPAANTPKKKTAPR